MKEKKNHRNTDISKCGKGKASFKQDFSYNVMSLRDTTVWNILPDPERIGGGGGQKAGGKCQNPSRT